MGVVNCDIAGTDFTADKCGAPSPVHHPRIANSPSCFTEGELHVLYLVPDRHNSNFDERVKISKPDTPDLSELVRVIDSGIMAALAG